MIIKILTMLAVHSMFSKWTQTNESAPGINHARGSEFTRVVFAYRTFAIFSDKPVEPLHMYTLHQYFEIQT